MCWLQCHLASFFSLAIPVSFNFCVLGVDNWTVCGIVLYLSLEIATSVVISISSGSVNCLANCYCGVKSWKVKDLMFHAWWGRWCHGIRFTRKEVQNQDGCLCWSSAEDYPIKAMTQWSFGVIGSCYKREHLLFTGQSWKKCCGRQSRWRTKTKQKRIETKQNCTGAQAWTKTFMYRYLFLKLKKFSRFAAPHWFKPVVSAHAVFWKKKKKTHLIPPCCDADITGSVITLSRFVKLLFMPMSPNVAYVSAPVLLLLLFFFFVCFPEVRSSTGTAQGLSTWWQNTIVPSHFSVAWTKASIQFLISWGRT